MAADVDRHHQALGAELAGDVPQDVGSLDGGGVDDDLVGTHLEEPSHVLHVPHAAPDCKRHEAVVCEVVDELEVGRFPGSGGRDVQEDEFVDLPHVVDANGLAERADASPARTPLP